MSGVKHETGLEAMKSFLGAFRDKIAGCPSWMACLWVNGETVELFRTTWGFPIDKYMEVLGQLKKNMMAEKTEVAVSGPLPVAAEFAGAVPAVDPGSGGDDMA